MVMLHEFVGDREFIPFHPVIVGDSVEFELRIAGHLARNQFACEEAERMEQPALSRTEEIGTLELDVRIDSAAAVNCAAEVRLLLVRAGFRNVGSIALRGSAIVIFEERTIRVITLNQTPARGVVMRDREGQSPAVIKREDALHQPLAETGFADDQATV